MAKKKKTVAVELIDHQPRTSTEYGLVRAGEAKAWFWGTSFDYILKHIKLYREEHGEDSAYMVERNFNQSATYHVDL